MSQNEKKNEIKFNLNEGSNLNSKKIYVTKEKKK